jgi:HEAT repeat protein
VSNHERTLTELLERMSDDTPPASGKQTASFKAHRDAEKLGSPAYVAVAAALLATEKRAERKRHLYFILGHLGASSSSAEVETIVRPALTLEKNAYTLAAALGALRRLPALADASDVRALLKSPVRQVREAAILALRGDRSGKGERDILALLKRTQNRFELAYALQTLGEIGSVKSIPAIASFIHHRVVEVKCAAIAALSSIGGKAQQKVFLDALTDKNEHAKALALFALQRHGDALAVPKVAARVIALLRKTRATEIAPSDLVAGLEFLARHRQSTEARDAVEEAKRLPNTLFPAESRWIKEHLLEPPGKKHR